MNMRDDQLFKDKIYTILREDQVLIDEPLKDYTSFKIGGPCDYFMKPENINEISGILKLCHEASIPVFILGNGSNLLVTDKGYRGAVIHLYTNFNRVEVIENTIRAEVGISLAALAGMAARNHLTGLEFASGIPGTLGGAVYMNAGAYGGEMKQVVTEVVAVSREGEVKTFSADELEFGYRHSKLQDTNYIALDVTMVLEDGEKSAIKDMMKDLNSRRKEKQPLEYPSAGSTFKRPEGYYAGKLIMDSGLSGYRIGDAMVSDKHCGFVINAGDATFNDVYQLIQYIQKEVLQKYGVELEREVKIIGER